jgi:hypothetical protein
MRAFARTAILALVVFVPRAAWAQSGIAGVVRDTTGAVLPGVTVEARSPALIEGVRTVTTDEAGQYRLVDLRPGVYGVMFTLAGFNSFRREGIELTAGFTATVNAELRVGSVEETITVSGQTPLVDTQNVAQHSVMTREVIETLPTGKKFYSFAQLTPGLVVNTGTAGLPVDVGGSAGETGFYFAIHGGRTGDMVLQLDGMRYNQTFGSGNGSSLAGFDAIAEEINYEFGAMSAEWASGGVRVNQIPKEGGNRFSGGFYGNYSGKALQSSNLSPDLIARGLRAGDTNLRLWDENPTLGGPLKQNKLWFFFSHRYWGVDRLVADTFWNKNPPGLLYEPDLARQAHFQSIYPANNLRLTWQASPKHKLTVYYDRQSRCTCFENIGRGIQPEASNHRVTPIGYLAQVKWTAPITNKLLLQAGSTLYNYYLDAQKQPGVTDFPSTLDSATGRRYNSATQYMDGLTQLPQSIASMSYVTGTHALKIGMTLTIGKEDSWLTSNGDINYTVNNGEPTSVTLRATPIHTQAWIKPDLGLYVQDQWTTRRLTLNLGLRYDYFNGMVPRQELDAGTYIPARTFEPVYDVPKWNDLSPRLGASYDLFGNAKTALKVSVNRYLAAQTTSFANSQNPVNTTVANTTRPWADTNRDAIPQESELGPLANPNFGRQIVTTRTDDAVREGWFKRGFNWETSVGIQHELIPRMGVSVSYFRRWYGNFTATDNLNVTPGDYDQYCITAPSDTRLPGGGGFPVCGLYDIRPEAFARGVDNQVTFTEKFGKETDVYNGVDAGVTARFGRLTANAGLSTGRTETNNCAAIVDSPQKRFCDVSPPFLFDYRGFWSYTLPWEFIVSGTFQSQPPPQILATATVTAAQILPSLGRPLAGGVRTVSVELIEPGTLYGERMNMMDLRFAKTFRSGRVSVQPQFDLFNVFNANSVLFQNNTFGPEWLRPTTILTPRFAKVGVQIKF